MLFYLLQSKLLWIYSCFMGVARIALKGVGGGDTEKGKEVAVLATGETVHATN